MLQSGGYATEPQPALASSYSSILMPQLPPPPAPNAVNECRCPPSSYPAAPLSRHDGLHLGSITHAGGFASRVGETDWFSIVSRWALGAFPHANLTARNGAVPGTPASYMVMCLELSVRQRLVEGRGFAVCFTYRGVVLEEMHAGWPRGGAVGGGASGAACLSKTKMFTFTCMAWLLVVLHVF